MNIARRWAYLLGGRRPRVRPGGGSAGACVSGVFRLHGRPSRLWPSRVVWILLVMALGAPTARAEVGAAAGPSHEHHSLEMGGATSTWPTAGQVWRVLTLRDYNTRLVVAAMAPLGAASGLIGVFLLLRKRSLIGDALSHATLPGIAVAFMVMAAAGGDGKWLPGLLAGAAAAGLLGVGCVLVVARYSRLNDDTAMGIVLSTFFGLGAALLGVIQNLPRGNAAGLESFIYGKTASMVYSDFVLMGGVGAVVVAACGVFFKELGMLCFDEGYAKSQGWPVWALDMLMLALVTAVTVAGLQAVGLILVIALLIIPAAAARFWTDRLSTAMVAAGGIGAASGWLGASLSALTPKMPAGAVVVLVGSGFFGLSMMFGPARGLFIRAWANHQLVRKVATQHLLRAVYEIAESKPTPSDGRWGASPQPLSQANDRAATFEHLLDARSWSAKRLNRLINAAVRDGLIERLGAERRWWFTKPGLAQAQRVVRNHRLWEMYLITHADIAPSHVDRDADLIEHVLGERMVAKLEDLLRNQTAITAPGTPGAVPPSPHAI